MSGLFGAQHPFLGQGALPPLAGRGVGRGAQFHEGPGESAACAFQGTRLGVLRGLEPGRALAGAVDGGEGVVEAVAGAPIGDDDRGAKPTSAPMRVSRIRSAMSAAVS